MKKILLLAAAFLGISAGGANAACTSPAVMHDFPGTAFNMSLASAPDGNCASNNAITTWGGVTLGAASNYGTSPGTVAVPGVNAFVTNTVPVTGTFWQATQPVSVASLPLPSNAATSIFQATNSATTGHTCSVSGFSELGCLGQMDDDILALKTVAGNPLAAQSGAVWIGNVDPHTAANWGIGATGSAPPANGVYQGANVGGNLTGSIKCGSSVVYDASTSGPTQLVALSGSTSVYVCGYTIVAGGTVNVNLSTGTGTACATSTAKITPAYQLTAQAGVADGTNEYRGLKGAASSELCINTSAAVAVQAIVYYTQF